MDFNALVTALVTNGIGAVCAAAVLWFAYYRETRTIPGLMKTFTETLAEIQKSNTLAITTMQGSFEKRSQSLQDTFTTLTREERATCQEWHEENRAKLDQVLAEQKENRHYIRDLAQQAGLQKAVEAEQKRRAKVDEG